MKYITIVLIFAFLLVGCTSRKAVVDPNDIAKYNSADWTVKKEPVKDSDVK